MARTRRVSRRASKKVARRTKASKASRKSSRRSKASKKSSIHSSSFATAKSHKSKAMKSTVHEYDTTSDIPMKLLRKKVQKKSKFVKRKRSSKRKGKSPYNLFVKKRFAVHKKENPDLKAPQIMKKIANEWKSR